MRLIECEQGSDVWLKARCGIITASRMADVLSMLKKGGESQARAEYRMELVAERLTGMLTEKYVNGYMQWGTDTEPLAAAAYEVQCESPVETTGFILHPWMDYSGASPDRLVGTDGGLEIKCPKTTTHLTWMMADTIPEEHLPQCYWNLICAEREWIDFVSYDPRLPLDLQMFVKRMYRDDKLVSQVEGRVRDFNDEIIEAIERLHDRASGETGSGLHEHLPQTGVPVPE